MSDELTKKLKNFELNDGGFGQSIKNQYKYYRLGDKDVEQIKQAFIADGWTKTLKINGKTLVVNSKDPLGYVVYYTDAERMTGKEWYDKFEKLVDEMNMQPPIIDGAYLDAAKRAAGLEKS